MLKVGGRLWEASRRLPWACVSPKPVLQSAFKPWAPRPWKYCFQKFSHNQLSSTSLQLSWLLEKTPPCASLSPLITLDMNIDTHTHTHSLPYTLFNTYMWSFTLSSDLISIPFLNIWKYLSPGLPLFYTGSQPLPSWPPSSVASCVLSLLYLSIHHGQRHPSGASSKSTSSLGFHYMYLLPCYLWFQTAWY